MLEGFMRGIAENPKDQSQWLILADWFEEQNDARAELVRLQYALRQPGVNPERPAQEERLRALLADGVQPCQPRLTNSLGMQLVLIPPGTFVMGSADSEPGRRDDEGPQHVVTITRPFYLGVHPVTQRHYKAVIGKNPAHFKQPPRGSPEHPVEELSWIEAVEFCRQLSLFDTEHRAGRHYRLATEAEWEYACRAGTSTPFPFGHSLSAEWANFNTNCPVGAGPRSQQLEHTTRVGQYPCNGFGLHDMHGNLWEWCSDWYQENYYDSSPGIDPQGPDRSDTRVLRGGAWGSDGRYCRSATRGRNYPDARSHYDGFRIAMTPLGLE
jgi:uncharacterized protein (TIGR02996 family)